MKASELPGVIRPRLRGQEDMDLPVKMERDCHQTGIGRDAYAHRGSDHCDHADEEGSQGPPPNLA
jgi:hypothetical protein